MLQVDWDVFKEFIDTKSLYIQYIDEGTVYFLWTTDSVMTIQARVIKDGGAEQIDFEDNYKTAANTHYSPWDTSSASYALKLDDSTPSIIYVGCAVIGTVAGDAYWQIKKIDETSGLIITWADGNAQFDNIWDDRASLSYS